MEPTNRRHPILLSSYIHVQLYLYLPTVMVPARCLLPHESEEVTARICYCYLPISMCTCRCVAIFLSTYIHVQLYSYLPIPDYIWSFELNLQSQSFFFPVLNFFKTFFSNFTPFFFPKDNYWGIFRARSRVQTRAKHSENTPRGPRTADRQCDDAPILKKSVFFRGFVAFCELLKALGTHVRIRASQTVRLRNTRNVASGARNSDQLTSGWNPELRARRLRG